MLEVGERHARRGLAVGMTAAGFGAGAVFTVIPIGMMIDALGYANTFFWFGIGQGVVLVAFEGEAHGLGHIAGMLALEIDAVRGEPGQHVFIRWRRQPLPRIKFEIARENEIVAAERPGFRGPREIEKRTKAEGVRELSRDSREVRNQQGHKRANR